MPAVLMKAEEDARDTILKSVGDLSGINVMYSQVLIGIYMRPEKTAGGIILSHQTRDEDRYQGKVGLVLKMGPMAFQDTDDIKFEGQRAKVGDWVVIRASDGWALSINKHDCRMVSDAGIRMIIDRPDIVW